MKDKTLRDKYGNSIEEAVYVFSSIVERRVKIIYVTPQPNNGLLVENGSGRFQLDNPRSFARRLVPLQDSEDDLRFALSKLER